MALKAVNTFSVPGISGRPVEISREAGILAPDNRKAVQLWSLADGRCLRTFSHHTGTVTSVSVVDTDRMLAVAKNTVALMSVKDGQVLDDLDLFQWNLKKRCSQLDDRCCDRSFTELAQN